MTSGLGFLVRVRGTTERLHHMSLMGAHAGLQAAPENGVIAALARPSESIDGRSMHLTRETHQRKPFSASTKHDRTGSPKKASWPGRAPPKNVSKAIVSDFRWPRCTALGSCVNEVTRVSMKSHVFQAEMGDVDCGLAQRWRFKAAPVGRCEACRARKKGSPHPLK